MKLFYPMWARNRGFEISFSKKNYFFRCCDRRSLNREDVSLISQVHQSTQWGESNVFSEAKGPRDSSRMESGESQGLKPDPKTWGSWRPAHHRNGTLWMVEFMETFHRTKSVSFRWWKKTSVGSSLSKNLARCLLKVFHTQNGSSGEAVRWMTRRMGPQVHPLIKNVDTFIPNATLPRIQRTKGFLGWNFTCSTREHQTFQVPKMEVLTYISCMDTAYVRENPPQKFSWL